MLITLFGNPDQKNEILIATEAGFRKAISDRLSFDSTVFFNQLSRSLFRRTGSGALRSQPSASPSAHPQLLSTICFMEKRMAWRSFADVKVANRWTL